MSVLLFTKWSYCPLLVRRMTDVDLFIYERVMMSPFSHRKAFSEIIFGTEYENYHKEGDNKQEVGGFFQFHILL